MTSLPPLGHSIPIVVVVDRSKFNCPTWAAMTLFLPYYMQRFPEGALERAPLKFETFPFPRLTGFITHYAADPRVVKIDR